MNSTLTAAPRRRPARRAHARAIHPAQQNVIKFFEMLLDGVKETVPSIPATIITDAHQKEGTLDRYLFHFGNLGYIEVNVHAPKGGTV